MFRVKLLIVVFAVVSTGVSAVAQSVISVNFVGGRHFNDAGGLTVDNIDIPELLPDESAGFVSATNWTNVARPSISMNAANGDPDENGFVDDLIDNNGLVTTMDLAWMADNTWRAPKIDIGDTGVDGSTQSDWLDATGNPRSDEKMLTGYLDVSGQQDTVSFSASKIPFAAYDLYVYVGASGNDRVHNVTLDTATTDPDNSRIFYATSTANLAFTGPADYLRASSISPSDPERGNYVLYEGLLDSAFTVTMTRPSGGNGGVHGFQVVQRVAPSVMRVNTLTGQVFIDGGDVINVEINGIELGSIAGALAPERYRSLGDQRLDVVDGPSDPDETPGNSPGESWEIVLAERQNIIEGFLFGSTPLAAGSTLSLGRVFEPDVGANDLTFTYTQTNGLTVEGIVEYFQTLEGDFNGDGVVDAADYTRFRENLGATDESLIGNAGNGDGVIDSLDYELWRENLGLMNPPTVAVPEPVSVWLALISIAIHPHGRRYR